MVEAFGSGGTDGVAAAMDVWNSFDQSLQQSIAKTYPSLIIALDDANKAADHLSDSISDLEGEQDDLSDSSRAASNKVSALGKELGNAQKSANAKYFKSTASAMVAWCSGAQLDSDSMNRSRSVASSLSLCSNKSESGVVFSMAQISSRVSTDIPTSPNSIRA